MTLHENAAHCLRGWSAPADQPEQESLREAYLEHLAGHPDGVWKSCRNGHITASALVVDPLDGRVLLTLHGKIRQWLQMGGHCEPEDTTLAAAALREATEESGIEGLRLLPGGPTRLDRHRTPCAIHLDVQYTALAPPGATAVISDESLDLRWFRYEQVAEVADRSVVSLVDRARELLAG
ncbi:NUDIX hydrolase [Streptomyces sp. TP-A0874]|uniref:NUDIX hydrolase n=1 Tax=Streptomyces sp. TP-A0874 TaxID=549819 RepID=UPI000852A093|nr:NUDIX domain-containing protein [Streptomyces sp. TP-A0874]